MLMLHFSPITAFVLPLVIQESISASRLVRSTDWNDWSNLGSRFSSKIRFCSLESVLTISLIFKTPDPPSIRRGWIGASNSLSGVRLPIHLVTVSGNQFASLTSCGKYAEISPVIISFENTNRPLESRTRIPEPRFRRLSIRSHASPTNSGPPQMPSHDLSRIYVRENILLTTLIDYLDIHDVAHLQLTRIPCDSWRTLIADNGSIIRHV